MRLTGRQRYRQACLKARIRGQRNLRLFLANKIDSLPGTNEQGAIIDELERAYAAGFKDGVAESRGS
jgi:hypothetical protein